jgi:hypothetical protein
MTLGEEIRKVSEPELSMIEFPRNKGESHSSLHSAMHQEEAFGQDLEMLQELGEAFSAALEMAHGEEIGKVPDCRRPNFRETRESRTRRCNWKSSRTGTDND